MKKQRLLLSQIILLLVVVLCTIVIHNIKNEEYISVGAFDSKTQNIDFSDLAALLYDRVL